VEATKQEKERKEELILNQLAQTIKDATGTYTGNRYYSCQ
jgi:hypothetical protein